MTALPLFIFIVSLSPLRGERDYGFKWALAEAIVDAAPDDVQTQRTLARIAWLESAFRRAVARCEIKGDRGASLGAFQVKPIDRGDDKRACSGDLRDQARLAKSYVDRSAEACPGNVGADRLALYVSGRCTKGLPQAKHRWEPEPPFAAPATPLLGVSTWEPSLPAPEGEKP